MGDRQQELVVGGVDDAVGATPDVVEGHRLQVGARVDDAADDLGAGDGRLADGGEHRLAQAAGLAVAVGVEEHPVGGGADEAAIDRDRDLRRARHGRVEEQPGPGAVAAGHDGGRQLGTAGAGGVEAVGGQRGQVDFTREGDQRALRQAHVGEAVGRRQRRDIERRQGVHPHVAGERGDVACGVARFDGEHMGAVAEVGIDQRGIVGAGPGVRRDAVHRAAVVEAVRQLGDGAAGAQCNARQADCAAQRGIVSHAGQRQHRSGGVERKHAEQRCAGVAGPVDGDDRIAVVAIGAAVQRQAGGEAEAAIGGQGQRDACAAVDADGGRGHARQVVQHLAAQRRVGVGGGRNRLQHHVWRLEVLGQCKARQHGGCHLAADGVALRVVEAVVDAAIDAAEAGLGGRLAETGVAARDTQQRGRAGGEADVVAEDGRQDAGAGCAERGMARDVAGVRRRDQQRCPVGIDIGGGIAVLVGQLDGGDRAPVVVGVLGVPAGDGGIGQRHRQLGHHAGIGTQ